MSSPFPFFNPWTSWKKFCSSIFFFLSNCDSICLRVSIDSCWVRIISSLFTLDPRLLFELPGHLLESFHHVSKGSYLWTRIQRLAFNDGRVLIIHFNSLDQQTVVDLGNCSCASSSVSVSGLTRISFKPRDRSTFNSSELICHSECESCIALLRHGPHAVLKHGSLALVDFDLEREPCI